MSLWFTRQTIARAPVGGGSKERQERGTTNNSNHDCQGRNDRNLDKGGQQHLRTHGNQYDSKADMQKLETNQKVGQQRIKRTHAKNGEDIRCEHNKLIGSDCKDSWNRIQREYDIADLDQYQGQKQWSCQQPAITADNKRPMFRGRGRNNPTQHAEHGITFRPNFCAAQKLDSSEHK